MLFFLTTIAAAPSAITRPVAPAPTPVLGDWSPFFTTVVEVVVLVVAALDEFEEDDEAVLDVVDELESAELSVLLLESISLSLL